MSSPEDNFKIPKRALARLFAKCRSQFTPFSLTFLLSLIAFTSFLSRADDKPSGIYQDIDVRVSIDTIKALRDDKGKKREAAEKLVMARPGDFNPPVLYQLSSVLFEQGKKDEALFWFYAGQLRGRIDANICADKSARGAIDALNQKFGPLINQYSRTNLSVVTNTTERVLVWEEKTPCNYDRRWINLQGMNAATGNADSVLSAPQNQWEAIRKRARDQYASEFHEALAKYLKRQH